MTRRVRAGLVTAALGLLIAVTGTVTATVYSPVVTMPACHGEAATWGWCDPRVHSVTGSLMAGQAAALTGGLLLIVAGLVTAVTRKAVTR